MWKRKSTNGIYGEKEMKKLSDDVTTAQVAVLKLKWLIGARRYMKDPKVKETLKKAKGANWRTTRPTRHGIAKPPETRPRRVAA
jgi:hypothetical protein